MKYKYVCITLSPSSLVFVSFSQYMYYAVVGGYNVVSFFHTLPGHVSSYYLVTI